MVNNPLVSKYRSRFYRRLNKRLSRTLALLTGRVSDNVEVDHCPICCNKTVHRSFLHKEWLKQCYTCSSCLHSFLPDFDNVVPADYFVTYLPRARIYANIIAGLDIHSLLEVGTSDDFRFLNLMHELRPDIKLYGHDIFVKDNVPRHVTMIDDLTKTDASLIYASHVLEHFTDAHEFGRLLRHKGSQFIIEVPNCPESYVDLINTTTHGTGYHYQFFNVNSLSILLEKHAVKSFTFVRTDPDHKRNIRGSLVSSNIDYSWTNLVHDQYDVISTL